MALCLLILVYCGFHCLHQSRGVVWGAPGCASPSWVTSHLWGLWLHQILSHSSASLGWWKNPLYLSRVWIKADLAGDSHKYLCALDREIGWGGAVPTSVCASQEQSVGRSQTVSKPNQGGIHHRPPAASLPPPADCSPSISVGSWTIMSYTHATPNLSGTIFEQSETALNWLPTRLWFHMSNLITLVFPRWVHKQFADCLHCLWPILRPSDNHSQKKDCVFKASTTEFFLESLWMKASPHEQVPDCCWGHRTIHGLSPGTVKYKIYLKMAHHLRTVLAVHPPVEAHL